MTTLATILELAGVAFIAYWAVVGCAAVYDWLRLR